jgi:hypothetical protein
MAFFSPFLAEGSADIPNAYHRDFHTFSYE